MRLARHFGMACKRANGLPFKNNLTATINSQYLRMSNYTVEAGFLKLPETSEELFYQTFEPKGKIKRKIIFQHGLGEHSSRYKNMLAAFDGTGTAFYGMDARGHGRSSGKRGHVDEFDMFWQDLHTFIEQIAAPEKDEKFFLLGHSMGGLIVGLYALQYQHRLKGLIFSSTAFSPVMNTEAQIKKAMGTILAPLIPKFTMQNGIPASSLTHDESEVAQYENDPLVHSAISIGLGMGLLRAGETMVSHAHNLHCPTLVFHGSEDSVASVDTAKKFFENVGSGKKTLKIWPGLLHETMNEKLPEKEKVLDHLKEWVMETDKK